MLCGFEIEVSEFRLFNRFTCHVMETIWMTHCIPSDPFTEPFWSIGESCKSGLLASCWSCLSSGPPSSPSPCHAPNAHWAPVVHQQTDWIKKEGKSGQDLLTNLESGSKARFIHGNTKGHDRKGT